MATSCVCVYSLENACIIYQELVGNRSEKLLPPLAKSIVNDSNSRLKLPCVWTNTGFQMVLMKMQLISEQFRR